MSDNSVEFTLSAKIVNKITREELGYELSSNSFNLLNQKVKEYLINGLEVEEVNKWIERVLKKFKEKKIVRRCDIESVIAQEDEKVQELDIGLKKYELVDDLIVSNGHVSVKGIEIVQLPSVGQIDLIRELEEEIERLKKIIQIILNKQAELV
jgi:hypothetical protein